MMSLSNCVKMAHVIGVGLDTTKIFILFVSNSGFLKWKLRS